MKEAKVALQLVGLSDLTSLYPNRRPTSTSILRCHRVAPINVPGLSKLCSRCSLFGRRNAAQWRRPKARTCCRPSGHATVGSMVRNAVAGIYENRSLRFKTPSTWADWIRGTSVATAPTKPTSTTGNTAQPAALGHATVMQVRSGCALDRRQ